jgi:branched-subunit amino acid transport protein AzlD
MFDGCSCTLYCYAILTSGLAFLGWKKVATYTTFFLFLMVLILNVVLISYLTVCWAFRNADWDGFSLGIEIFFVFAAVFALHFLFLIAILSCIGGEIRKRSL